ncbi:hypothetical protein PDJAM_G00081650, partial [Pangasius djambal]|nr:hypothetical protein [Pangasius djambal]
MKVYKSQVLGSVPKLFPPSSPIKMGSASATMFEAMFSLFGAIRITCSPNKWHLFTDIGFTMFPCYLCLWDSKHTKAHYQRRDWPQQTEFTVGRN